jgi:hypothetical protein
MALFTDGTISTIENLTEYDSSALAVAATEGIDLSRKLELARQEIGVDLAALLPVDTGLEHVVVTTPLRLWHTFRTLALAYGDAYHRQLNDRYRGKWTKFREMARWASEKLRETGLGMVRQPVLRAEAAELAAAPGSAPEGTYYVQVAWVNTAGEEGAASEWRALTLAPASALEVRAVNPPAHAAGWHIYAGLSGERTVRQNAGPLEIGAVWVQSAALAAEGAPPGAGQAANYIQPVPRVLHRG